MREPSFDHEAHPQSGRNPPTPKGKAAKKAPAKKPPAKKVVAKKAAAKRSAPVGRTPPLGDAARRAAVDTALANAGTRVVVTGIDVDTGKQVSVIVQGGRNPPTGSDN